MAEGNASREAGVSRVSVEPLAGGGFRIDDRIDRRTVTVRTDRDVTAERVSGERFERPLDVAVVVTAGHLELVPTGACFVHGPSSSTRIDAQERESRGEGRSVVEISGTIKVYVEVQGPCTVGNEGDELTIDLDRPDTVVVGARSYHDRPATTVRTTEDPIDAMAAVSTFGTALKSRTCERSYPTLRGHPPTLEVGEEPQIPSGLEPPEDDVHLEVPRDLEAVLAVAPLAYYLGARVDPGARPTVVVDGDGYRLDGDGGFEATVERTLKRTLFMDCLVRTASTRAAMLYEREELDAELPVDIDGLEGRPPHERLAEYMRVPFGTIEPYLPDWRTAAHVRPTPAGIEALPFLAYDLAVVRVPDRGPVDDASTAGTVGSDDRPVDRSTGSEAAVTDAAGPRGVVRPPETDAVGQAWVGPGVPVGASKTLPTAYHNRLDRGRRDDEAVDVAVVCNDEGMFEEGETARDAYGSNGHLPFDVSVHDSATTGDLAGIFESERDYVHYVGHVGEDGFECADGTLDIGSVEGVGVDIAFLNACRSYEQGFKLVEQGATASVVTFGEVLDEGAVRIGKTMARLLNQGFCIARAVSIARSRSIVGSQYLVVGDANADIAQARNLVPWVTKAEPVGTDRYRVRFTTSATKSSGLGAEFVPSLGDDPSVYLVPKTHPPTEVSRDRFRDYLELGSFPVLLDGEFTWSEDAVRRL